MPEKFKVFFDTSALIAGLNSPAGAAGVCITLCHEGHVMPIISPDIVAEMERNLAKKFPDLFTDWQSFLVIPPIIADAPTIEEVRIAHEILSTNDASILASAMKAKPDILITWNTKDFMRPKVIQKVRFPIVTPGEFLKRFRAH